MHIWQYVVQFGSRTDSVKGKDNEWNVIHFRKLRIWNYYTTTARIEQIWSSRGDSKTRLAALEHQLTCAHTHLLQKTWISVLEISLLNWLALRFYWLWPSHWDPDMTGLNPQVNVQGLEDVTNLTDKTLVQLLCICSLYFCISERTVHQRDYLHVSFWGCTENICAPHEWMSN